LIQTFLYAFKITKIRKVSLRNMHLGLLNTFIVILR
jgi:hypothetical protein